MYSHKYPSEQWNDARKRRKILFEDYSIIKQRTKCHRRLLNQRRCFTIVSLALINAAFHCGWNHHRPLKSQGSHIQLERKNRIFLNGNIEISRAIDFRTSLALQNTSASEYCINQTSRRQFQKWNFRLKNPLRSFFLCSISKWSSSKIVFLFSNVVMKIEWTSATLRSWFLYQRHAAFRKCARKSAVISNALLP